MRSLEMTILLITALLLGGCGGKTPDGIIGDNLIEIRGTATVTGVLELPNLNSMAKAAADSGSFVPGPGEFTVQCGEASCTPDASGAFALKGIKPGKKLRIRAFSGNIELTMKVDELFPNQIVSGASVGPRSTASALLRDHLDSAMPGLDTAPLPEDLLTLATHIEGAISSGRHMLGRVTELPETVDSVKAAVEKMKRHGRGGPSKGAIDVWRLTEKVPETEKFDANGDGFLSDDEFRALKRYLSLLIPETIQEGQPIGQGTATAPSMASAGFAGEPAVAVSALTALSESVSVFDADGDSMLTETESSGLFRKISALVQSLPGMTNPDMNTLVQVLPAGPDAGLISQAAWASDPGKATMAVAGVFSVSPWLFEGQAETDPALFDAKLAGFIAGLPSLSSRESAKSFSMGIVEAGAPVVAATATGPQGNGSAKTVVSDLLGRYPGAAILDGDSDGFLDEGEMDLLRSLIAPVTGSGFTLPGIAGGSGGSDGSNGSGGSVGSGGSDGSDGVVTILPYPLPGQDPDEAVFRQFCAPVERVKACMNSAKSHDQNADGFLGMGELNDLLRRLKGLFVIAK